MVEVTENENVIVDQSIGPNNNRKKILIAIGALLFTLIVIILINIYLLPASTRSGVRQVIDTGKSVVIRAQDEPSPAVAPLPFKELTIPFLTDKKYESKIGEMELAFQGANYSAYITNYVSDGLRINALMTRPAGDMPEGGWPAIVFVHGYIPPAQYETNGQAYSAYVDYLAQNGLVVFKIDLRGHGNSEGEAGGGYFGADYVVDTLNAYAALQNSDFVNPNKIGMWGHSMAGNALLRSFAAKKDIPAIVVWAGAVYSYTDLIKYRLNDQSYRPPSTVSRQSLRRQRIYEKVGSPSASSVFWQNMAPVYFLKDLKGAIQLHHAVDDDVVNIGYSRDLAEALEENSINYELYEYDSGGHNISGSSFNTAMQRTVEFFNKYLNP